MKSLSASFFYGFDDRIQKLQLLACRAVQRFDSLGYCGCVDIGHPFCQFYLAFFGLGVIHDQIDRCHASDNGHLLGRLPGMLENQDVEPCHFLSNVCSQFVYTFLEEACIIESS